MRHRTIVAILLACPAFAQQFDVASIKLLDRSAQGQVLAGIHVDGAQIRVIGLPLRALLADRFQVKLHKDKKEFPVYALLVAKGGSKMKETPDSDAPDQPPPARATPRPASKPIS